MLSYNRDIERNLLLPGNILLVKKVAKAFIFQITLQVSVACRRQKYRAYKSILMPVLRKKIMKNLYLQAIFSIMSTDESKNLKENLKKSNLRK